MKRKSKKKAVKRKDRGEQSQQGFQAREKEDAPLGIENALELAHLANRVRWLTVAISWMAMIIVLFEYYNNQAFIRYLGLIPEWVDYVALGVYFVLAFIQITEYSLRFQNQRHIDHPFLSKLRIFGAAINLILTIYAVTLVLYAIGVVSALFDFFQSYVFPQLGSAANWVIANLLGWILAGVIGNFVYDIVKAVARWTMRFGRKR